MALLSRSGAVEFVVAAASVTTTRAEAILPRRSADKLATDLMIASPAVIAKMVSVVTPRAVWLVSIRNVRLLDRAEPPKLRIAHLQQVQNFPVDSTIGWATPRSMPTVGRFERAGASTSRSTCTEANQNVPSSETVTFFGAPRPYGRCVFTRQLRPIRWRFRPPYDPRRYRCTVVGTNSGRRPPVVRAHETSCR